MGQDLSRHRTPALAAADLEKLLPLDVSDEKAATLPPKYQVSVSEQPIATDVTRKRASVFSKVFAKKRSTSREAAVPSNGNTEKSEDTSQGQLLETALPEPASPFLKLPNDLRNRIYEAALVVSGEPVMIHSSGTIVEPAILGTCKQIRKEAASIFYTQNRFRFKSLSYETGPLQRLNLSYQRISERFSVVIKLNVQPLGDPSWANVKSWVQHLHGGEITMVPGLSDPLNHVSKGGSLEKHLMYLAFKTAVAMRGTPWEKVEPLVEDVHLALVRLDPLWE